MAKSNDLFIPVERETLDALARRRGFKTAREYVVTLIRQDVEQHGETLDIEDELPDPFESFKRGWDDVMHGRTMSYEEFERRILHDDD
jgi:hypothetical protein